MIIPTICKSCGKNIGHLWFRYLEKVRKYQKERDDRQNEAELARTEARLAGLSEPEQQPVTDFRTPESRAMDELLIHRYCCRTNFICQPEGLVDMIRNRVEN